MDNEPYHDLGHHEAADILADLLREHGNYVDREHRLPSGVIADLFVITPQGIIEIYEIKTLLKSSLLDNARKKYAHWCNRLWCAVPHLTKQQCEEGHDLQAWRPPHNMVGLMGVYRDAFIVFRNPHHQAMDAKLYSLTTEGCPKP